MLMLMLMPSSAMARPPVSPAPFPYLSRMGPEPSRCLALGETVRASRTMQRCLDLEMKTVKWRRPQSNPGWPSLTKLTKFRRPEGIRGLNRQ